MPTWKKWSKVQPMSQQIDLASTATLIDERGFIIDLLGYSCGSDLSPELQLAPGGQLPGARAPRIATASPACPINPPPSTGSIYGRFMETMPRLLPMSAAKLACGSLRVGNRPIGTLASFRAAPPATAADPATQNRPPTP
jgi:hypothetical protein